MKKTGFGLLAVVSALVLSSAAFGYDTCNRNFADYNKLKKSHKDAIASNNWYSNGFQSDTDYNINCVFTTVEADPELVMAVFSSYDRQFGNIGSGVILDAKIQLEKKNWARVYYEMYVPFALIENAFYSVDDTTTKKDEDNYIMTWNLSWSKNNTAKTNYVDGYMAVSPFQGNKNRTYLAYCNYAVPDSGMFKDTFNEMALKRVEGTVTDLKSWVKRVKDGNDKNVKAGAGKSEADYRARFRNFF